MTSIRRATEHDLTSCAAIIADSLLWERYGRSFDDALVFFSGEFERNSDVWVYDDGEGVLGYLVLITRGMMGEFPFVRALGVRSDRRGQGIGTTLLRFAEEKMLKDSRLLFMMVSDFNESAQRLYTRLGFETVGTVPDYKKEGISEYILVKRKA